MDNNKPLCLKIEDAKDELAEVINRHKREGLPFYLLEPILKDLYQQVTTGKGAEVEAIRQSYEVEIATEKNAAEKAKVTIQRAAEAQE